jgi:hypothetical protein
VNAAGTLIAVFLATNDCAIGDVINGNIPIIGVGPSTDSYAITAVRNMLAFVPYITSANVSSG